MVFIVILSLHLLDIAASLSVYNTSIPVENDNLLIGLKYKHESNQVFDPNQGYTSCVRFNFRKLDSYLFYFGQANHGSLALDVHWNVDVTLTDIDLGNVVYVKDKKIFHIPWFGVGTIGNENSLPSVNNWNHLCIACGPRYSTVTLVLVVDSNKK